MFRMEKLETSDRDATIIRVLGTNVQKLKEEGWRGEN